MNKYGIEHFHIEPIEYVPPEINLEERESMSINSNSDNDNGNEGEEYIMGDSTKSIRKNERMAKNNKKNKNEQNSQKFFLY